MSRNIIVVVAILLMLMGCSGAGDKRVPQASERLRAGEQNSGNLLYTAAYAMRFVDTEPERALVLIDSARLVGNLSEVRADIQRARVYGRSLAEIRNDSAILIAERLMLHDSVKADYDLQIDVLEILLDAYRLERDYEQALYWATRLSDVYREHGLSLPLFYSNAEIGALMVRIGQQQEGQQRNRILARQITEAVEYREKLREREKARQSERSEKDEEPAVQQPEPNEKVIISDFTQLSDKQLYRCLRELIEDEQLFLLSDFERQTLIDRTGLSKERIGTAFSQGGEQDANRLTTYIRELRLDYAVRLLNDQPDLSIEHVSQSSGFISTDTFTRNFRAKFGMTPTAYRRSKQ